MARNLRNARVGINRLVTEIKADMEQIRARDYLNSRAIRQLNDGDRFLKMITVFPYTRATTVGRLKKEISTQRNTLKEVRNSFDKYLPGYQFTIDDINKEQASEYVESVLSEEAKRLDAEIHWLRKALGICSNMDYFK